MRRIVVFIAAGTLSCVSSTPPTAVEPDPPPSTLPELPRGCGLPAGGPFQRCSRDLPFFNHELNAAIAQVQDEVPELFDFSDGHGGLSYRVLDRERYHAEVVARLEGMGFCAVWDGEEVGVKNSNDFNEQYQVMTSLGYVRWGGGSYRSTCYPAWF
jgi:hypothetical protein